MPTDDRIDRLLAKMSKTGSSEMSPSKVESGDGPGPAIPPFSGYSVGPERPPMTNSPRCPFSGSFTSGPIPAPGTHQDQFAAVLCPSRYSSMPTPPMGMELSMSAPSPNPSLQHPSTFNMHFAAPGVATLEALPAPDRVASYVPPDVGSPQVHRRQLG
ncbi:hypothetical protein F5883DRAFT_528663 [Diaporthe sp. PMI_573]|nr:hypothetical protein F5883DRAFT_528663 [Diaporthaceae sp. PMI_573]